MSWNINKSGVREKSYIMIHLEDSWKLLKVVQNTVKAYLNHDSL